MKSTTIIKQETLNWVNKVVIGLNFCPFAAPVVNHNKLHIEIVASADEAFILQKVLEECAFLDKPNQYETSLVVLPKFQKDFLGYLELLEIAERLLEVQGYEGIYQIASFHPEYIFAQAKEDDAANYTNRSPYPMFHLIPEASLEEAIATYPDVENIPSKNQKIARDKGLKAMELLRSACFILPK